LFVIGLIEFAYNISEKKVRSFLVKVLEDFYLSIYILFLQNYFL